MRYIHGGRRTGRTMSILREMAERRNSIMFTANQHMADMTYDAARAAFPHIPWERSQFRSFETFRETARAFDRHTEVHFDNLDLCLQSVVRGPIGLVVL